MYIRTASHQLINIDYAARFFIAPKSASFTVNVLCANTQQNVQLFCGSRSACESLISALATAIRDGDRMFDMRSRKFA